MRDTTATLVQALLAARGFEDAATAVLTPMLDIAERALAASRHAGQGRILRAMVHLRPDDGYRGLVVLEAGRARAAPVSAEDPAAAAAYLPSASAFRWVAEHRAAVSVDVSLGKVEQHGGGAARRGQRPALEGSLRRESTARLMGRSSTHLHVLPLRAPGVILGMISLEAECRSAMGRPFIWADCTEELQLIADIGAPHLAAMPLTAAAADAADPLLPVVGASMSRIVQVARVFAQQDETLLITGPTGAGKSRLARWCHARSRRRERPFEVVDLLSIPDELQMGELFGWKKGAFSGAVTDNPGSIARAEGGTLFIDEIDKLSLKAQAGLLHVMEERSYRPLGEGAGERRADVRFIVGTNASLEQAASAGRFREDLYYRVNVLPLRLPPLDERADEIPLWARYMLERRHREGGAPGSASAADAALLRLSERRWPGNLRQLDNVVRRAYALALVDSAAAAGDVVVEERHVERALGYERSAAQAEALPELLGRAAAAFVGEAERRAARGEVLDADLADGFKGLVMAAAARRVGSQEAAFKLLGKASLVAHRNHRKVLRREVERALALLEALGERPAWLAELLASPPDPEG